MSEWAFFFSMMAGMSVFILGSWGIVRALRNRGYGPQIDWLHDRGTAFQRRVELAVVRFLSASPRRGRWR